MSAHDEGALVLRQCSILCGIPLTQKKHLLQLQGIVLMGHIHLAFIVS